MFCEECGKKNDANTTICQYCGYQLQENNENVNPIETVAESAFVPTKETDSPSAVAITEKANLAAVVEPVVQEVNSGTIEVNIKKKMNVKPFIWGFIIILIAGALGGAYIYFGNNKERIIRNSFEHLETIFTGDSGITYNMPNFEESLQTGNVSLDFTSDDEFMNSILGTLAEFGLDFTIESRSDSAYFDVSLNNNDSSIIGLEAVAEGERIYLNSEVLDFPLYVDLGMELFQEQSITMEDLSYLSNLILERFILDMDSSAYTQSREKINIDGSNESVTKTSITLNAQDITVLANKILNYLRKDERAKSILVKLYEDIDNLVISIPLSSQNSFVYNVYTTGLLNNNILGIDFIIGSGVYNEVIGFSQSISLEYRSGNNEVITAKGNGGLVGSLVIEHGNREIKMEMFDNVQNKLGTLTITNPDDNKLNMQWTIDIDGEAVTMGMNLETEVVTANQEYNMKTIFNIAYIGNNINNFEAAITVETNIKDVSGQNALSFNTAGARSYDSLTSEEEQRILDNLESILMGSAFSALAENYFKNNIRENIINNTYCSQAFNCECFGGDTCSCSYIDEDGDLMPIECPTNDYYE